MNRIKACQNELYLRHDKVVNHQYKKQNQSITNQKIYTVVFQLQQYILVKLHLSEYGKLQVL